MKKTKTDNTKSLKLKRMTMAELNSVNGAKVALEADGADDVSSALCKWPR